MEQHMYDCHDRRIKDCSVASLAPYVIPYVL
jgi:hypothetical protein